VRAGPGVRVSLRHALIGLLADKPASGYDLSRRFQEVLGSVWPALLRSVFFWLMTPEELAAHLDREAAYFHQLAAKLRDLAGAKDRGEYGHSPQTQSLRVTVEAGIRINEALEGWAAWAKEQGAKTKAGPESG